MAIITDKKTYTKLRAKLRELDYPAFGVALQEITGRGSAYISGITRGRKNFDRLEMDKILEAIGEKPTNGNYLEYFPTLGIEPEAQAHDAAVSLLREALGGIL